MQQQPPNNNPNAVATAATPSWFLGAPLSKLMLVSIMAAYFVTNSQRARTVVEMDSRKIRNSFELYRYWTSKLTFATTGELLMGTFLLIFLARKYEREMGSRKFLFLVLLINMLTILMEMVYLQSDLYRSVAVYRYSGPYPLLGGLFLGLFHRFAPRMYPRFFSILGFQFSEKTFYYLWFFHCVGAGGWSTLIAAMMGWMASLLTLQLLLPKLEWPEVLVRLASQAANRLGENPPHIVIPRTMPAQQQRHPIFGNNPVPPPIPPVQQQHTPDPAAVEQLCGMGFSRERVEEALRVTNNDVQRAADRLLTQ